MPTLVTIRPLTAPMTMQTMSPISKARPMPISPFCTRSITSTGAEREHRADRQIELAGGHQQRHAERDDAELRQEGQHVARR